MSDTPVAGAERPDVPPLPEGQRIKTFVVLQIFFLLLSPLCGGFHYKMWSMLDTALLIGSIGITALVPVLESRRERSLTLRIAIVLYLAAIADMSINVLVSGWLGWQALGLD